MLECPIPFSQGILKHTPFIKELYNPFLKEFSFRLSRGSFAFTPFEFRGCTKECFEFILLFSRSSLACAFANEHTKWI